MRIHFFSYFYPPCIGGGEVILAGQARELARRGHHVEVFTTPYTNLNYTTQGPSGSTLEQGVHVHRRRSFLLPFRNPLEKDAVTPAFWSDAWRPADLVVCVGYPSLHLDLLVPRCLVSGTPLVVQNYITAEFLAEILEGRGGIAKKLRAGYWRVWTGPQLRAASLVIADSPAATAALGASLGLSRVHTHIGMAVDPAELDTISAADRGAARQKLALDGPFVLAPSRISRQKGADLLLDVMTRGPAGSRLLDRARLVVAGPVNEPDFHAALLQRAKEWGDRVRIVSPSRPELLALMAEAGAVVLPSRGETVGGVCFEAMYLGVPVVVSDAVEAAREDYLRDGRAGRLVAVEDHAAWIEALHGALAGDPERVAAGRRLVEERFTWRASVDRLLQLYRLAGLRGEPPAR